MRWMLILLLVWSGSVAGESSPVTVRHLDEINVALQQRGIANGYVRFDDWGRVTLSGEYHDELEVDAAFSAAQTVVGVRWVSPVTPENIKVKEWERRIGNLFSRARVLKPESRRDVDAPPGPVRNKFALVVGVGRFKYGVNPLEFAAFDAMSMYRFLTDPARGKFPRENAILLTDEEATLHKVRAAMERIRQEAGPDDLVVVYMSSHGAPPDKKGAVNIVTHDTEIKPRERIWHTSLTEEMFKEFVDGLRAKRLVMILDTCYSNGAYRAVPGFLPPGGKSLGSEDDEGYGIGRDQGKRLLGAKDLVIDDQPTSRGQKAVGQTDSQGWGKVLIGASGSGERSWESDQLRQSIFTHYFVDGLKRYDGSVQTAFYHAKPLVYQRVREEKGSDIEQTPQVLATTPNWNFSMTTPRAR
jgi:hypothetical protein